MELAPNTREMPTILVVAVEGAEMQYDSIETSEIPRFGARFSVHHLFLKPLSTGISEKRMASRQMGGASEMFDSAAIRTAQR